MSHVDDRWVVRPLPRPDAALRLFCFPSAGGGTPLFHSWPSDLPDSIEVCSIHLPGRNGRRRERLRTDLLSLSRELADFMESQQDKPCAFFGHSLGGWIGFELARELRRRSLAEPQHLFVSASYAPQIGPPGPPFHGLPDAAFIQMLHESYAGIPQVVAEDADLLQLFLPILRADFTLIGTYSHQIERPLDCPISAFGGNQDPRVTSHDLEGWRSQTTDRFTLQMFPGDHFFMKENRTDLLAIVTSELLAHLAGNPPADA